MKQKRTLHKLIYSNYLTSSLIPIFAIEIVLLVLYFGVSYFITNKSQNVLYEQATQTLNEITVQESKIIDGQFKDVGRLIELLRDDHEQFYINKECLLPNGEPTFAVHKNGVYFKPVDNGGGSLYYSSDTKLGKKELNKARCSEVIDPLMKSIVDTNPIVTQAYLNTYDNLNRIYPYMPDAPAQYGPILHMIDYNFYYLADKKHNPDKKNVWTSAYLDPAGQGWMISNIVPVYNGDFLEGVTGLDVTVDAIVKNVLSLEIPWNGSAFLVDKDGMILAMSKEIEKILGLKELKEHKYESNIETTIEKPEDYNILKGVNSDISKQMEVIFKNNKQINQLVLDNKNYTLAQKEIPETKWRLMVVLDDEKVYASVTELKEQANVIGYYVIFAMVLFYLLFFFYLLRKSHGVANQISNPIEDLSQLTTDLGKKENYRIQKHVGITEVDSLIDNFNDMSTELDIRTEETIQAQLREKTKEKDAEIAYRAGLFESASSYLHNIGNALTVLDTKIVYLRNITEALKKSGKGIQKVVTLLNETDATQDQKEKIGNFLGQFEKALSVNVTSELNKVTDGIFDIKNHAVESIRHQQDVFNQNNEASDSYIQCFDLKDMLDSLVEDFYLSLSRHNIKVNLETKGDLNIKTMKFQFLSGLTNVIKNAIEAIKDKKIKDGTIDIQAYLKDDGVEIIIKDNGSGIDPKNKEFIFKSGFTTKEDGHGLGLHAFNNFLNAKGGNIRINSDGVNKGASVVIQIGLCDE